MKMIYGSSNVNKVKDIKSIIKAHEVDIEVIREINKEEQNLFVY